MKILVFSASSRNGSLNKALSNIIYEKIKKLGLDVSFSEIKDYETALYDGDVETSRGVPLNAQNFKALLDEHEAVVIVSPEYNFSTPGNLKNLIDWASRIKQQPFRNKQIFLASASPSLVGGNRGLWSLRIPLSALGAHVYPDMFSLSLAHEAFTGDFKALKDEKLSNGLEKLLNSFLKYANNGL
jgi:chromate reductase, NAD(P)H dehydrogenase (quinone)